MMLRRRRRKNGANFQTIVNNITLEHNFDVGSNLYRKKAKKKVKEIAQLRYCGQFISPYQAHLQRACEKYKTIMALEKMK